VATTVLALILVPWSRQANAVDDLMGARGLAMGNALTAAANGSAGLFLNPAGMILSRSYAIEGIFLYRPQDTLLQACISVVDSHTSRVAAGLYYAYTHSSPRVVLTEAKDGTLRDVDITRSGHEVGLSLAYPFGNFASIGTTTRYQNLSSHAPSAIPGEPDETLDDVSTFDMDVGVVFRLGGSFNLGIVGRNLVSGSPEYPRRLALGASYSLGTRFLVDFDTVIDFQRYDGVSEAFNLGAEIFVSKLAIRAGFSHDTGEQRTYVTGGLGFVAQRFAIEAGLRQGVQGGARSLLAASIRLFFD
jgi:hypothetical protein